MTFKFPYSLLRFFSLLSILALLTPFAALAAPTLTGVVTNGTTGKPSAGDQVVLLLLVQGMTEAGRTTTDAKGHFSLSVPDAGPHLIRVEHQKGAYFRQAPPGTQSVEIKVYDIAEKVPGVSTEADVMRMETDNTGLKVTENFFVRNTSSPPRTQLSEHSYEIYLPENVQIEGSAAMSPGGMPVSSSPVPLGEKGHYAFAFPIRPNEPGSPNSETRFQLSYHIPYSGSYKFTPHLSLPTENVAILLPKSMKFTGSAYQAVNDDPNAQTFLAKNVQSGQPVEFSVSGTGVMPRESQGADTQGTPVPGGDGRGDGPGPTVAAPTTAANGNGPGGGLGVPIDTPDPLTKYRWWILGGLSILLAVAAAFFLRKPTMAALPAAGMVPAAGSTALSTAQPLNPATQRAPMLAALKEELFALETERLEGKLTVEEYATLKSAFETVLRRTLAR